MSTCTGAAVCRGIGEMCGMPWRLCSTSPAAPGALPHLSYCTNTPPDFWHSVLAAKKAAPLADVKDW